MSVFPKKCGFIDIDSGNYEHCKRKFNYFKSLIQISWKKIFYKTFNQRSPPAVRKAYIKKCSLAHD